MCKEIRTENINNSKILFFHWASNEYFCGLEETAEWFVDKNNNTYYSYAWYSENVDKAKILIRDSSIDYIYLDFNWADYIKSTPQIQSYISEYNTYQEFDSITQVNPNNKINYKKILVYKKIINDK